MVDQFVDVIRVQFIMPDGSKVSNILADGPEGQLYLTYQFDWNLSGDQDAEAQKATIQKWKTMSKTAIEGSLKAMRELVGDGTIKA